jgi:hypothetical protein
MLEEANLKKGSFFELIYTLFYEVKWDFVDPWKIVPFK